MRRRKFLESVGQAGLALGVLPLMPPATPAPGAGPRYWTWVHGNATRSADEWRRQFRRLGAAGFRGVLVSGGDGPALSALARAEGLEFHRWIWALNRSGDAWVKQNHPEWFTVSRNGDSSLTRPPYVGYYQWLCPSRPEVRDYLDGIVAGLASDPAHDGVHLDYIRHADVILPRALWSKYGLVQDRELPEFDFCYCEVCRELFRQQSGADPLTLPDPTADAAWRRFRWDSVTGLVRRLAATVHAAGKPISAAVFPTPAIARALVRQAWDEWPLDLVFPMAYHTFYNEELPWLGEVTREDVAAVRTIGVNTGLYLPDMPWDDLEEAVRIVTAAGAAGVSFFEMGGLSDTHLMLLRMAAGRG